MKRRNVLFSALAAPPLPMMLAACAAPLGRDGGGVARAPPDRMTVLCDAFGRDRALQKDWGYAALLEVGGKRILFDTGNDAGVLEKNAAARHVDLSRLDFVVMSHRHGDHMGGIPYLLKVNPKVKIFAPKEGFGVYGFDLPGTFFRKDDTLAAHERYYDGRPPEVMRFGKAWPEANITLVDKSIELAPGVHAVALVSDKPGTLELRELSLAVSTPEGLVILVGCSHPGIDKIVQAASAIDPRVHLVAGGFHLVVAKDPEIQGVIGVLRDTLKVHYVAPGHCTGEPTFAALKSAFGDRYLYAGLGSTLTLGVTPQLVGDSVRAGATLPSADDLAQYRALSAANDARRRGLFVGLQPSATPGAAYLGRLQRSLAGCC